MRYLFISFLFFICTYSLSAQDAQKDNVAGSDANKVEKVGNLAFASSQQPNAFISFGQNILNKGQTQILCLTSYIKGEEQYFINVIPSVLHGITDNLSIFISTPVAVRNKQNKHHSYGLEDALLEFEYAYFTKEHKTYYDQATVIAAVTIPTGSVHKNPNTGNGSPSFFVGGTLSRMGIDWFYFVSSGGFLTTSRNQTKIGNQLLYQMGIGRRIASNKKWLFDWMLELDGTHFARNTIKGHQDNNSGGHIIFVTPSLWLSNEHLVLQVGAGYAVYQHWFGKQNRSKYLAALNCAWTF